METRNLNFRSFNVSMRKLFLTASIFAGTFLTVQAGNNLPAGKDKEVAVTSIGVSENGMLFNVKYGNENGNKFSLVLTDQEGVIIYKEVFTDKMLNKTFKAPAELGSVIFTITDLKERESKDLKSAQKGVTFMKCLYQQLIKDPLN